METYGSPDVDALELSPSLTISSVFWESYFNNMYCRGCKYPNSALTVKKSD